MGSVGAGGSSCPVGALGADGAVFALVVVVVPAGVIEASIGEVRVEGGLVDCAFPFAAVDSIAATEHVEEGGFFVVARAWSGARFAGVV